MAWGVYIRSKERLSVDSEWPAAARPRAIYMHNAPLGDGGDHRGHEVEPCQGVGKESKCTNDPKGVQHYRTIEVLVMREVRERERVGVSTGAGSSMAES